LHFALFLYFFLLNIRYAIANSPAIAKIASKPGMRFFGVGVGLGVGVGVRFSFAASMEDIVDGMERIESISPIKGESTSDSRIFIYSNITTIRV
jgi:hypothetical protein